MAKEHGVWANRPRIERTICDDPMRFYYLCCGVLTQAQVQYIEDNIFPKEGISNDEACCLLEELKTKFAGREDLADLLALAEQKAETIAAVKVEEETREQRIAAEEARVQAAEAAKAEAFDLATIEVAP